MYNNNNKAQLLILGPLVIWASLSYGSSVKTHEYIILHHRQYRSAPSVDTTIQDDKPGIVQAQIEPISRFPPRLYSFDPRPNIDPETLIPNYKSDKETLEFEPTTTMKSSTVSSSPLPSHNTPKEDTSDSPTLSTSSPSTIDVQHLGNTEGGSSDDPLFSVRDAIMTGRAVQKVYSALDSVAGFMPVKLKYIDPQQVSIDTIDSESTSDSKDVGKPSSENSAVIESVTREESSDRSTEVVSTEKEVSEVSDHDTELVSTEKEGSEGSDRDTELVSIEKEGSEVSNHDTELVSAEKEMSELSLHDDVVSSHTENSVSKGTAINESRGIVGVSQFGSSGVSYIIHPDNQPAPTYVPMENLPPPSRPVAQWRPDIFMKICCSEPDPQQLTSEDQSPPALLKVKTGYAQVGTTSLSPLYEKERESEESIVTLVNDDGIDNHDSVPLDVEITHEQEIIEEEPVALSLFSRLVNETLEGEPLNITESNLANETASHPEVSSNHTPRYEEAGSTYQDVTNFLRDLASSEGFQNAFLGDLIKNFGDLDQNAMKLIYSLLIGPLEGASKSNSKSDRIGAAPEPKPGGPNRLPEGEDFVVLGKDRLPLRDQPANGYHPFGMIPPRNRPWPGSRPQQIRPSSLVRQVSPVVTDKDWRPVRTKPRLPSNGRRGDEDVDVITAPPFKTFEVVLGSSLNHDGSKPVPHNLPRDRWGDLPTPPPTQNTQALPFDKLTLGLEMPPPDALDALPPGSVLIPPSQILKQPNLPHIFTKKDGTPSLEIPLSELQPNLPFFGNEKPLRFRPPSTPQIHDIPPRLPSFLSSLLPQLSQATRPKVPPRMPNLGPILQRPFIPSRPPGPNRPMFSTRRRPTGPPPPVTKLIPPGIRNHPSPVNTHHPSVFTPSPVRTPNPSMFTPQKNEEKDNLNGLPESVNPSGIPVSGPIPVPMYVPVPSGPAPSPTVNPGSLDGSHLEEASTVQHYLPHLTTSQPMLPDLERRPTVVEQPSDNTSEEYHSTNDHPFVHVEENRPQESDNAYYRDVPLDYILDYYDYRDYYDEQLGGAGMPPDVPVDTIGQPDKDYELGGVQDMVENGQEDMPDAPVTVSPSLVKFDPGSYEDMLMGHQPNIHTATLSEQEKNDLQMLLQNHRMANAIAEANGTVFNMVPGTSKGNLNHSSDPQEYELPDSYDTVMEYPDDEDHYMISLTGPHGEVSQYAPPSPSGESVADVEYNEHDASIAHLWNNIQLIPLAPELFNTPEDEKNSMNLTALFNDAVPLSPDLTINEIPDLGSDVDRISIDNSNSRVIITEEVDANADAKFMAYVLIGACCGLALLSIAGVIVIVRFKKTCGSRQIRTRTRLTEQDSVENISRRVENLTLGGDSGHKLGSWFTGRNEQFGSGKLRSNMALPTVHDLKREKSSKSGSTRDLLSISSESSQASSPRQGHHGGEATGRTEEEEPRTSWLHDEYRASLSDLSQAPGQDLAYIPRQYQQSRALHEPAQPSTSHADHQRYRDVSMESEQIERSSRERRYTGQSRRDSEHSPSHRRPHFVSSMDSEELEERLDRDNRYPTDSEVEDWTTNYEDESREPSRYLSDSRELDDAVARRNDPTVTSQELGDQLSRDLKQYQSRRGGRSDQELRDSAHNPESSQEVDVEDTSRESQRSQSQVSFSRDNVQNEVFLEFDNIFRQHGQYLNGEAPASTLGRISRNTEDTTFSASRANTPDSIDLPDDHSQGRHLHDKDSPPSAPTTPPRFSPPPPPPRPPKPGHLSQPGTPSPRSNRARPPSPGQSPPSPPRNQRPVYWTSEEERLI